MDTIYTRRKGITIDRIDLNIICKGFYMYDAGLSNDTSIHSCTIETPTSMIEKKSNGQFVWKNSSHSESNHSSASCSVETLSVVIPQTNPTAVHTHTHRVNFTHPNVDIQNEIHVHDTCNASSYSNKSNKSSTKTDIPTMIEKNSSGRFVSKNLFHSHSSSSASSVENSADIRKTKTIRSKMTNSLHRCMRTFKSCLQRVRS